MKICDEKNTLTVANADLSGSTFADVSLRSAQFTDVNLSDARFTDINLSGSKFTDLNLANVEIEDCNVSGMKISGVLVTELLAAFKKKANQAPEPTIMADTSHAAHEPRHP